MAAVPVNQSVPSLQNTRYEKIKKLFEEKYGKAPAFYSRSPGRVNLIGEHIDYCGYAVLPMAIEQDIVIAAHFNDTDSIKLANTQQQNYSDYSCKTTEIIIDGSRPLWHHYFLCGYRGIVDHYQLEAPKGMELLVDGTIPHSAGLSSSSALVCCAALATSRCNGKEPSKLELAEICQHCEHFIGTEGGGMDQAISLLAEPGEAMLIEFNPIRTTNVQLPDGGVFVITNCCQEMNKAATSHFNVRVAECRLASQVLGKLHGLNWRVVRRLVDLQNLLKLKLGDMAHLVTESLHKKPYSKKEICDILEVTPDELNDISLSEKTFQVENFKLCDRALHVYSEAHRVWEFKRVCDEKPADALVQLGSMMKASHESCRDLYECSCDDLDELTHLCMQSGALGSRLTGAGWGGCAVSLLQTDQVDAFLEKVTKGYYRKTPDREARLNVALFATKPGGGAAYYIN